MSVLKASPTLEVPHVEVHNTRDWDLVDDISLGLPGGMDSENAAVLFVKGGALRTAVRLTTPTDHILQVLVGANPEEGPAVEAKFACIWRAVHSLSELMKRYSRSYCSPVVKGVCSQKDGG